MAARDGRVRLVDGARPQPGPAEILVAPTRSVLSSGTERAVLQLAAASPLQKARARPDLVRGVVRKVRDEGPRSAVRAVRDGLDRDVPLGYSSAGTVVEVGAAVAGLRPGQRVAAAGAGHGELQVVAGLLAVPVPDAVTDEQAAFGALGAVALNAVRAAEAQAGSRIVVVGMGLLGRLIARVAAASGSSVLAVDISSTALDGPDPVDQVVVDDGAGSPADAVAAWTGGRGADAVIIAAADQSGAAVGQAPGLLRDHARVVVVGDAALQLDRREWYERALQLEVVRSYGPGRYDPAYEALGVDYPPGYVRWTAGRNLEAFLDLLAGGRVEVDALIGHRVPFAQVEDAYARLDQDPRPLAVQLVYDELGTDLPASPPAPTDAARRAGPLASPRLGLIGAGVFVRRTLLPALAEAGWAPPVAVASRTGRSAEAIGGAAGAGMTRSVDEVLAADDVDVVGVVTTHDAHAALVCQALAAGKHVYCEKPLALDAEQLQQVRSAAESSSRSLLVGFNRRHAEAVVRARDHLAAAGRGGPLVLTYRVSTGPLPEGHWYHDRRQGGRILGEVCHFIDTAAALVPAAVRRVSAVGTGSSDTEALLATELVVVLEYDDGSLCTITVGSGGPPSTAKERIEVIGRGRSAVIEDFGAVVLDGRRHRLGKADRKGHAAQLSAFRASLAAGTPWPEQESALVTSAITLAAAESLLSGAPVVTGRRA